MNTLRKTLALTVSAIVIAIGSVGCGKSSDATNTNGTNVGGGIINPSYSGGVIATPGGGIQIPISGANVYSSGVRVAGCTQSVQQGSGTLVLGGGGAYGGTLMSGRDPYYTGTAVTLSLSPVTATSGYTNPLAANLSGSVTLSPQFVQRYYGGTVPSIQGLCIDLMTTSTSIYGGSVTLYTSQNGYMQATSWFSVVP